MLDRFNRINDAKNVIQGKICKLYFRRIDQFIELVFFVNRFVAILCYLQPSRADVELTRKINEAAKFHDIKVLDHIIITSEQYYSFADEGLI